MSLLLLFHGAGTPAVSDGVPVWNPEWIPDFVFVQSFAFDTLITDMPLGPEHRRARRTQSVATFELNFSNISKGMAASILAFYVDSRGPFRQFRWANPVDGNTYPVRFLEDSISREEIGEDLVNMTVRLKEIV